MNGIGIRQGRISSSWSDEFAHAAACGFDAIEWLLGSERHERNPIWNDRETDAIRTRAEETTVKVHAVCADYFIAHPFLRASDAERARSVSVLSMLIARCVRAGIPTIVLPVLEGAEIRSASEWRALIDALEGPLDAAARHGIVVALETDRPAAEAARALDDAGHRALGVCYDTGNAAANGYDPAGELVTLAGHVRLVHVKDRRLGGPNVPLGQGDVDFARAFGALRQIGYRGPLILETPPGIDPPAAAAAHLAFVKAFQ